VRALHCDKLEDGTAFLAMEYLDGVTLRQWLQRRDGGVPLEAARFVAREIADAMVEVHGKGIVHRDLKPENVMLVADDRAEGGPVLEHVSTGGGARLGTWDYMAPEQWIKSKTVSPKAEVVERLAAISATG
jgi:eukaryotic-like serine/threonine-protein kinase